MPDLSDNAMEEIKQLLSIQCKLLISNALIIETGKNKSIYELTGEKGQEEIKNELNVSPNTISTLWKEWEEKGILLKDGRSYTKTIDKLNKIIYGWKMNNLSLSEIIIRGRYLFKDSPKLLDTFIAIDGKITSSEIAEKLGRNVNNINRDIRSLRNAGLIVEIKKVGNHYIYDKIPLAKEIVRKDFEKGSSIPSMGSTIVISSENHKNNVKEFVKELKTPDQYEILEIIKKGEDQNFEFKQDGTEIKKITKEIAAFANTRKGGIILYGIEDDGTLQGSSIKAQDLDQPLQNSIKDNITPSLNIEITQVDVLGSVVIVVIVPPKQKGVVYLLGGSAVIRKGTNVFQVKADQLKPLLDS